MFVINAKTRAIVLGCVLTASAILTGPIDVGLWSPCWAQSVPQTDDKKADSEWISHLVKQLGAERFADREKAQAELEAIGAPALDLLRKSMKETDPEMSRRAAELVRRLDERALTASMLTPKKIRLAYDNVPLTEAVADFAKQSGYPITLQGDPARYADRKISLDTGLTTFWQAFEQFRDKAGVQEVLAPANPGPALAQPGMGKRGKGVPVQQDPANANPFVLVDGPAASVPTFLAGSVRVRAMPAKVSGAGEIEVLIDVTAEPRLQGFGVAGALFINKAVDDQNQALVIGDTPAPIPPNQGNANNGRGVIIINGQVINGPEDDLQKPRSVAVRLKLGEKPAKSLQELSGTLTLQALKEIEPLVTVENILKAAGKTVKGKGERALQIHAIEKLPDGAVKIQVTVEIPRKNPMGNNPLGGNVNVVINGVPFNGLGNRLSPADYPKLIDAQGKVYTSAEQNNPQSDGKVTLIFRPEGEPVQLVLYGRQTMNFAVPFVLKNIPLR